MNTKIKKEGMNRPLLVYSLSIFLILAIASAASAAATVSVQPQTQDAAQGAIFSVNVNIDSGSDALQSVHVELNFNTSVLTNPVITPGTPLGSGILNEPSNGITPGKVTYGVARTNGNPAVPVNGVFFTVQFQVRNDAPTGVSILDLGNVNLYKDPTTNIASPTVNDGLVNVIGGGGGGGGGGATVSVVPLTQNAAQGATFSVNVNIDSGSDNLQAAHVELNYDTRVLTATGFTKGTLLGTGILDEPNVGISSGRVIYGAARTSGYPAVPVSGTFFTVQFQVNSGAPAGTSRLDLVTVNLKSSATSDIPNPEVNNGMVTVTGGSAVSAQTNEYQISAALTNTTQKPAVVATTPSATTAVATAAVATPAAPAATANVPGFEAVSAIAGLLAVAYLVLRQKK